MTDLGADHFERWREDEATAEAMIPLMGRLYRDSDVILYIFGKKLNRTSIEIMKAHRYARNFIDRELSVQETMPVLVALTTMQLDSAKIDIGKLAAFLALECPHITGQIISVDGGRSIAGPLSVG